MKMKNLLLGAILGLSSIAMSAHDAYQLNANSGTVKWLGEKVGGEHYGKVAIKSGSITMHDGALAAVDVTIDMTQITCDDIEDEKNNQYLIGHLKSDDFFGVEQFPTATFKSTKIEVVDKATGEYKVTGNLTIKGKSLSHTITVHAKEEAGKVKASAEFNIDRTQYDIKYKSKSFFEDLGDKFIYDEFKMTVDLTATK